MLTRIFAGFGDDYLRKMKPELAPRSHANNLQVPGDITHIFKTPEFLKLWNSGDVPIGEWWYDEDQDHTEVIVDGDLAGAANFLRSNGVTSWNIESGAAGQTFQDDKRRYRDSRDTDDQYEKPFLNMYKSVTPEEAEEIQQRPGFGTDPRVNLRETPYWQPGHESLTRIQRYKPMETKVKLFGDPEVKESKSQLPKVLAKPKPYGKESPQVGWKRARETWNNSTPADFQDSLKNNKNRSLKEMPKVLNKLISQYEALGKNGTSYRRRLQEIVDQNPSGDWDYNQLERDINQEIAGIKHRRERGMDW